MHSKGNYKQGEKTAWEKIIPNETTDKGFISRIYKQLKQFNTRKKKTIKKSKDVSPKKTYKWPTNMKRCSASLIIGEMQIKTTLRYHLTWSEWPSSKSLQTMNAGKGVEKREHSCSVHGNVNLYSDYGRWYGNSLEN